MNTDMAPARPVLRDVGALLRHADQQARAAAALPVIIRQRLSPDQGQTLREDDLSLTGGFVEAVVRQLGDSLFPGAEPFVSATIAQQVVLASAPVIRLLHARAIEARLCGNGALVGLAMAELPPRIEAHAADSQDELAEAAMAVIVAQSRFIGNAQSFSIELSELPPEHVSMLVQQALAWAQEQSHGDPLALRTAADALLVSFDERRGRPHRLMRFCHLFELPRAGDDWSLAHNGPSLVFAMLARASGLPSEFLVDMMRDPDLARLCVVLRACNVDARSSARLVEGLAALASLQLNDLASADACAAIAPEDAARMVAGWRNMLGADTLGSVW